VSGSRTYRLAHRGDGEHPACSESVILPMCNVIYLGMQRYLSSSRGPRAEAGARGPRRAPGAPRGAGGGPPRRGWPRAAPGDVARLQVNIKNARDVLGDRGSRQSPDPSNHRATPRDSAWTRRARATSPTQLATHAPASAPASLYMRRHRAALS